MMRPNSLFFDRGGTRNAARTVSMLITIVFLAFAGYILIRYKSFTYVLREEFLTTPVFGWLLVGYLLLLVVFALVIRWANCRVRRRPALWALAIFIIALTPRIALLLQSQSVGADGTGNLLFGLSADMLLLSGVTSFCAVLIYLIARRFDEGSAPAAGLLFALYPANLAVTRSMGDVYGSVLFALASVLLLLLAFSFPRRVRAALLAALSGAALTVGCIVLDSLCLVTLAYAAFWLVLLLASLRQKKELMRLLLVALAFGVVFFGLSAIGLEPGGRGKLDLLNGFFANGSAVDGSAYNFDELRDGFVSDGGPARIAQNVMHVWMEKSESLGAVSGADPALLRGLSLMDFFFVAGVFLFAWFGALLRRRGGAGDLLLWIFLIWAAAHLLGGQQALVRSLGMPFLLMFAAYGFFAVVGPRRHSKSTPSGAACVNQTMTGTGEIPPRESMPNDAGGLYAGMMAAQKKEKIDSDWKGTTMKDNYQDVNATTVDRWVENGWEWGLPITHEQFLAAKQGNWSIVLTPIKPVPKDWFPELKGADLLGLACGGGQQMPLFAAAGANCTVLDYSERQLESERMVAKREGYNINVVRADMTKPLPFADASFDIIVHPVSNCYIREVEPLWRECFRVLRPGGVLLAGMDNGINYLFDESETTLTYRLPFDPLADEALYELCVNNDDGVQFSHTVEEQIGGQLKAGFVLTHLYEDLNGSGKLHEFNVPTMLATRAVKPK